MAIYRQSVVECNSGYEFSPNSFSGEKKCPVENESDRRRHHFTELLVSGIQATRVSLKLSSRKFIWSSVEGE